MHELGVTFHIMDHLEKVAKENEVEKIRKVVLELGRNLLWRHFLRLHTVRNVRRPIRP